jgi:hypothetical protein
MLGNAKAHKVTQDQQPAYMLLRTRKKFIEKLRMMNTMKTRMRTTWTQKSMNPMKEVASKVI